MSFDPSERLDYTIRGYLLRKADAKFGQTFIKRSQRYEKHVAYNHVDEDSSIRSHVRGNQGLEQHVDATYVTASYLNRNKYLY